MAYIPYKPKASATSDRYVPLNPRPEVIEPVAPEEPEEQPGFFKTILKATGKRIGDDLAAAVQLGKENIVRIFKGEYSLNEAGEVFKSIGEAAIKPTGETGLPAVVEVPRQIAADIIRAPLRFGTEATITALGEKEPIVFREAFGKFAGGILSEIFGADELKPFGKKVEEGKKTIEALGGTETQQKTLPPVFIAVGGILDFYAGGPKSAFQKIAKETSEEVIESILKKEIRDLSDDAAKMWAKNLKNIDNAAAVEKYIKNETKAIGEDVAAKLTKPAVEAPQAAKAADEVADIATPIRGAADEVPIPKVAKATVKAPRIPDVAYEKLDEIAAKIAKKDLTIEQFSNVKQELVMMEDLLNSHPARPLMKYVSRITGQLPEVTGQKTTVSLTDAKRKIKTSHFGRMGDDIASELGFEDLRDAEDAVFEYQKFRGQLDRLKMEARELRRDKSAISKGEKLMELARGDRRRAYRAVKTAYNLSEGELSSIRGGRDIMVMSERDFQQFMIKADQLAQKAIDTRNARVALETTIHEKELVKVDNLREALKLPPISQMTPEQMNKLNEVLEQFKQGDEFLGVRQLETVKNTDLSGIKTIREAREALAKQTGVPVEELSAIQVKELDKFRYDTALARQNPFYELMVDEKNRSFLNANAIFFKTKTEVNDLVNAARKSKEGGILQKLVPTDKNIFKWLESNEAGKAALAKEMTEAELKAATRIRDMYAEARDYLVQHEVLKKFKTDYITHIRRGFLEAWKEDGLMTAFKESFDQYKLDEAVFNILDQKTGDILPLEKFFQFSMQRTGALKPTENVARAVLSYFRAFEKKKALDAIVPKLDIYAHSLTPKKLTPKGLEFDDRLKRFVKEWINTKKGRPVETLVKPGGKLDWALRTGVSLTRILDLGLSIPIGLATSVGEQVTDLAVMGARRYALGVQRLTTKSGRDITTKYVNFVGEKLTERLTDAAATTGDKLLSGVFSLFAAGSRRANQVYLLGMMTPEEFAKGAISTKRLAEIQKNLGKFRVVEGFESIAGATSLGGAFKQYRTWAVPIISTTTNNIKKATKMIVRGDKSVLKSVEFQELMRSILISGAIGLGYYGYASDLKDKKDRTFLEEVAFKSARDGLTLIGGLDPALWFGEPRLISFLNDFGTALNQIITLEENKEGELKGPKKLKQTFTPSAIRPFTKEKKEEKPRPGGTPASATGLPKLPALPSLPKLPKL